MYTKDVKFWADTDVKDHNLASSTKWQAHYEVLFIENSE